MKMTSKPNYEVRQIRDLKDMLVQSTELYSENEAFYIKSEEGNYKGIKYREFKKKSMHLVLLWWIWG